MPSTAAPETRPKLNGAVAKTIVAAIVAYKRADRALKEAKRKRSETLPKYRDQVPLGVEVEGAGHIIKRWEAGGGQVFSLKDYLEAGHEVTTEMAPFVHDRETYDQWSATPIEGPPEP
jgi:hypothetical protein